MDYKQDELDLKIKILTRYLIMAAEEKDLFRMLK